MSSVCLHMTSHAHSPALHPPPDMKYDLRAVPNPPKTMRDRYTGLDKRLRDEMQREKRFVELLERAEREVRELAQSEARRKAEAEAEEGMFRNLSKEWEDHDGASGHSGSATDTNALDRVAGQSEVDEEDAEAYAHVIRISVFCAAGQHRSVAFACALASCDWPRDWTVTVEHRDLGRKKDERKGGVKKRGKMRREVVGGESMA